MALLFARTLAPATCLKIEVWHATTTMHIRKGAKDAFHSSPHPTFEPQRLVALDKHADK
jgi:hypothetical protein